MADYYSLLSRAVANLPKSSPPTARRAIYERARKALNNQLRSLKPPLPESDILREEGALEDAMRRLEASLDPGAAIAPPLEPPPAPAKPVLRAPSVSAAPPRPPVARPEAPASARVFAPPPAAAPAAAAPFSPAAPTAARVAATNEAGDVSLAPPLAASRPAAARSSGSAAAPKVDAPRQPETATLAPPIGAQPRYEPPRETAPLLRPAASIAPPRETEPSRPIAPRPEESSRSGAWKWAALALVIGVIGAVAVEAFLLRSQKPQDLAIHTQETPGPSAEETPDPGPKIVERVGGAAAPAAPDVAAAAPEPAPAAPPTAAPAAPDTPASPPTTTVVAQDPTPAQTSTPPANPPATSTTGDRAAFLLAAPQDVQKPIVSLGAVTWSSPPANPGQGGGPGVRADVDIPDLKLHASMLLRRNVDPALPASHTIDLRLTFDDGASFKGVKDVGVPQMRREDGSAPTPLLGVRVVINDSYFLIGLNRADADMQRNLDAMTSSGWFDFPMLLPDGRIAKLTFEKGADGDKILASALAAWK